MIAYDCKRTVEALCYWGIELNPFKSSISNSKNLSDKNIDEKFNQPSAVPIELLQ